ncbi:MAG: gliding motility-associated C-terminal domain-containing protein [Chitinophagales bacterium]
MSNTTFLSVCRMLVVGVSLLLSFNLTVQADGEEGSCGGSLGDNIFTDGDFGSGTSNLIATDPQIAPGYIYTTNVPPPDGFYTITNNTGVWGGLYSSWLSFRDNSEDPNGYMMVVNADFSPGLFYEQTVVGLCANTQYEFSADIINIIRTGTPNHILPNVDFLLNNTVLLSTGNIPQSNEWNSYSFTFCTGENEETMVLSLINNAPGGFGNDIGLDNISFRACGPPAAILTDDTVEFICFDDVIEDFTLEATVEDDTYIYFQWQSKLKESSVWENIEGATGNTYTITDFSSGEFEYRYLLANTESNLQNDKCRLYSTIKQIVVLPIEHEVSTTICEGNSLEVGTSIYTTSGIYVDELTSSRGCDSILTTNLTVLTDPNLEAVVNITSPKCVGESNGQIEVTEVLNGNPPYMYSFGGETNSVGVFNFLAAGIYELYVLDEYGCDYTTEILIEDPEPLVVETIEDQTMVIGESVILNTSVTHSDVTYQWTPAIGLDCADCPNPTVMPFESVTYNVMITNGSCTSSDSVRLEVDKTFRLGIPTAFSPNEDGINDYFEITTPFSGAIQTMENMKVYNRWGQVVFETNEPRSASVLARWDGYHDFRLMDAGVYVYFLELRLIDDSVQTFGGTVTVIH